MNPHAESKTLLNKMASLERSPHLRTFVRVICFTVAIAAIWPVFPESKSLVFIPALSPFVSIVSLISTRTFHAVMWLGLTVGLIVLIYHRFFCRWICPVGLCVDGAGWLGGRLGRKPLRGPLLGRWILWLTLGGALLGYPILLWLDPLAIFANVPSIAGQNPDPEMWLPAAGFVIVIITSITWPKAWCAKICPLGAFQDILALARGSMQSLIYQKEKTERESIVNFCIDRRTVLGITAGAGLAWITRTVTVKGLSPLRPPGAADESQFAGLCTRCGNCSRVCPSKVIERDFGHNGLGNLFTPVLSFKDDYCREDCIRCTEVCPSGALIRLRLKEKTDIQIGLPHVNMNVCLLGDDRECSACKRWCPYDAIHYVFSQEQYTLIPRIDPLKCNGCGACEAICPTKPQKAIVVLCNRLQS